MSKTVAIEPNIGHVVLVAFPPTHSKIILKNKNYFINNKFLP
jgi:hypothetical protein